MMLFFMEIALIGVIGTKIFGESSSTMQGLSLFILFTWFLGLVVFIDLITLGGFKRSKKNTAAVYYYIYRFYSMVIFSFCIGRYCIILLTIRTLKNYFFSIYTLHGFDPPGASRHRKQYPPVHTQNLENLTNRAWWLTTIITMIPGMCCFRSFEWRKGTSTKTCRWWALSNSEWLKDLVLVYSADRWFQWADGKCKG